MIKAHKPKKAKSQLVEVSLAHFAAIGGLTEEEYADRMVARLDSDKLLDLLDPNAITDLSDWIGNKYLGTDKEFCIVFCLSLNRDKAREVMLYCICTCEFGKLKVREHFFGYADETPGELEQFELGFCDMKTRI